MAAVIRHAEIAGAGIYLYENALKVFEAAAAYDAATLGAFAGRAREMRSQTNTIEPINRLFRHAGADQGSHGSPGQAHCCPVYS